MYCKLQRASIFETNQVSTKIVQVNGCTIVLFTYEASILRKT